MRRVLALLVGAALIAGGAALRGSTPATGGAGDDPPLPDLAALEALVEGDVDGLFFGPDEVPPALTCAVDVLGACVPGYLGFATALEPTWTTFAQLQASTAPEAPEGSDGARLPAVWIAPRTLATAVAEDDDDRWVVERDLVEVQVVAVTRGGSALHDGCAAAAAPLTCLVEAADVVSLPDPADGAVGAAVLVALALEQEGAITPTALDHAVALLAGARTTEAPAAELLAVAVPEGEVALDGDAALLSLRTAEEVLVDVAVRWPRRPVRLAVAALRDRTHPQADRIRVLLEDEGTAFALRDGGAWPVGRPVHDRDHPASSRPARAADPSAADLLAARQAWEDRHDAGDGQGAEG